MNNKKRKQIFIIIGGLVILAIAVTTLIILENISRKKQALIDKAKDVFSIAQTYYEKSDKITFSSNGINSLNLDDPSLIYCVYYDEKGVKSLDITNGKYYLTYDGDKELKTNKVKNTSYDKFECTKPLPVLALSGYDGEKNVRQNIFGGYIEESKIEKITFVNTNVVPNKVIDSFDASKNKDKSVMAWYTDTDKNEKYELYIGGENGVATSEDASYLFAGLYNTKEIDLTYLDTTKSKTMKGMFYYLVELQKLKISNLYTINVKDMSYMFYYLIKLSNLEIRNFNTTNVENMESMFAGAWALTTLDLSNFETKNVKNMNSMFMNSSKLMYINLNKFDLSNVKDTSNMFNGCYMLSKIDIRKFNIDKNTKTDGMFCLSQYDSKNDNLKDFNENELKVMYDCPNN